MPTTRRQKDTRTGDPRLKTPSWKRIVAHWRRKVEEETTAGGAVYCQATPCRMPGVPIKVGGRRGPTHLDVGHHDPRATDDRTEWTIDDTRPEHQHCSRSHGSALANIKRKANAQLHHAEQRKNLTISNNDW